MKKTFLSMVLASCVAGGVLADPWAQTYVPRGTTVTITNEQLNSVWMPVAVLWKFSPATNSTLSVTRISQGNSYELAVLSVTNAQTVIWVAEAQYPFECGDVLQVSSTATNSVVQVIRKGK
jgi:hypothetical protein